MSKTLFFFVLFCIICVNSSSLDIDYDSLNVLNDFSGFFCGNFVAYKTDNQGRLAVEKDCILYDYEVGTQLPTNCSRTDLVGGVILIRNSEVGHGKVEWVDYLDYDQSVGLECGEESDANVDFDKYCSGISQASLNISMVQSNGNVNMTENMSLVLTGNDDNINTFSISSSQIEKAASISLNIPVESFAFINVDGTSVQFSSKAVIFSPNVNVQKVLWNFYQATDITIKDIGIIGSLIAPLADINGEDAHIDGSISSKNFKGTLEIHHFPYIPPESSNTTCPTCPPSIQWPNYSIFVQDTVKQINTDDEGRFFCAGDAYLYDYSVGTNVTLSTNSTLYNMVIGGDLYFENGQVNFGSILVAGKPNINHVGIPNGEIINEPVPFNSTFAFQSLTTFSSGLFSQTTNGIMSSSFDLNDTVITLSGNSSSANYFNIDLDQKYFETPSTIINIDVPQDSWAFISVQNSGQVFNGTTFNVNTSYNKILWNFNQSTSINISSTGFTGSILGTNAVVTANNARILGSVYSKQLQGTVEIHNFVPHSYIPYCPPC
eukprot:TRINITY_DN7808_c0_g1_i1.p1 TRINITY_DN7808_c0_g1~~TRINITY_DN7808_c0_g1_i1.p1  ORF type:complete len:547 (-),score=169.95 TRINITY_DN7808_c0_g1_i1:158-1798(-)